MLEREDRDNAGKGQAIAWALKQIHLTEFDAVFIVDADSYVDCGILSELNRLINQGEQAIQCYSTVGNREDSWFTQLTAEIGRDYNTTSALTLSPSLNTSYIYLDEDGYTEKGAGNLGLEVEGRDEEVFNIGFDVRAAYTVDENSVVTAHLGTAYDINAGAPVISSQFISGGPVFNTRGSELDSTVVKAGVGYEWTSEKVDASFAYEHEERSDFDNFWLTAKVRYRF